MVYESFPSENLCMTSIIDEDEELVIYMVHAVCTYVCTWIMEKMGHKVHTVHRYVCMYGWYNTRRCKYSGALFIRPPTFAPCKVCQINQVLGGIGIHCPQLSEGKSQRSV